MVRRGRPGFLSWPSVGGISGTPQNLPLRFLAAGVVLVEDSLKHLVVWAAAAIEAVAVGIIILAFTYGLIRFVLQTGRGEAAAYGRLKAFLGRGLLLALEFLVAADVIQTVALDPSIQNVLTLAMLVVVRTFLSWSVVVEIEGNWPWNLSRAPRPPEAGAPPLR